MESCLRLWCMQDMFPSELNSADCPLHNFCVNGSHSGVIIEAKCGCGQRYRLKPSLAGKKFKCLSCGAAVLAPKSPPRDSFPLPKQRQAAQPTGASTDCENTDFSIAENRVEFNEFGSDFDDGFSDEYQEAALPVDSGNHTSAGRTGAGIKFERQDQGGGTLIRSLFIAAATIGVLAGVAAISSMEISRRSIRSREEFIAIQKTADAELAGGEFQSALASFRTLSEHRGAGEDRDRVVEMRDFLERMLSAEGAAAEVKELSDEHLLALVTDGTHEFTEVPKELPDQARRFWMDALQKTGSQEVIQRAAEKKRLLSAISTDFQNELKEMHTRQSQFLEETNRNEVEEKTARKWMDDFFEILPEKLKYGMELADWADRFLASDAQKMAIATAALTESPAKDELKSDTVRRITIQRAFNEASVNMKEVPRDVSLTTRYTADLTVSSTVTATVEFDDGRIEESSLRFDDQVSYSWQSNRWELKKKGTFDVLNAILPNEIR
jgi:hypothetical protein